MMVLVSKTISLQTISDHVSGSRLPIVSGRRGLVLVLVSLERECAQLEHCKEEHMKRCKTVPSTTDSQKERGTQQARPEVAERKEPIKENLVGFLSLCCTG